MYMDPKMCASFNFCQGIQDHKIKTRNKSLLCMAGITQWAVNRMKTNLYRLTYTYVFTVTGCYNKD